MDAHVAADGSSDVVGRLEATEGGQLGTSSSLSDERTTGILSVILPSYLICLAIIAGLVIAGGLWEVLAGTRILSALISGGIVALSEDDAGLGTGVPGLHYFVQSQEPVTWSLVLLSSGLFLAVAFLKAVQFRRIAQFVGIEGTFSDHFRAYIYGNGLGRMLPHGMGEVAWATALEAQGSASMKKSAKLVLIFKGLLLFEIFSFAFIGLIMSGLLAWGIALVPPLAILAVSWILTREEKPQTVGEFWQRAGNVFGELAQDGQLLVGLALLSLTSFALVEFATYLIPNAFSSLTVPLIWDELRYVVVTPSVIVMAVVAGYIARLIPITPGGVGQFELAFALVLMANGLPVTPAVIVTLLASFVRYGTGLILFGVTMVLFGVETNFGRVVGVFMHGQSDRNTANKLPEVGHE